MRYEDVESHINKLCAGLVMRVREQTRSLGKWPEENSAFQKVLALINDLERVNGQLEEVVRKRREVHKGMETRAILAQAFQSAVVQVTSSHRIVDLDAPVDNEFVFKGGIFSTTEVLQFLADNQRSGEVKIRGEDETYVLRLKKGEIIGAFSTNSPRGMRLGEILVSRYGVSEDALEKFMNRNKSGEKMGRALAREDFVSKSIVYEALRFQTVQLFERCMAEGSVDIEYDPTWNGDPSDGPSLNLGDLLLDGILG